MNLQLIIPCEATVLQVIATLNNLLQQFFGNRDIDISNPATQARIAASDHDTIVGLVIAKCIEQDKNRYPVSSQIYMEVKSEKRNLHTVGALVAKFSSSHKTYLDAFSVLHLIFSEDYFKKLVNDMKQHHQAYKSGSGYPRLIDGAPTTDTQKHGDGKDGNGKDGKKKDANKGNPSANPKPDPKSATSCTICGHKHTGDCKFRGHANANLEPNIAFTDSAKG